MLDWKLLITDAKKAYYNYCYDDAIEVNNHALMLSKKHFDNIFISNDPEKAVALVVISYLNIIDSHVAKNKFTSAQILFEDIFYFLRDINKRPNKCSFQKAAIINAVKKLYVEWSLFLKYHSVSLSGNNEVWLKKLPTFISLLSNEDDVIH
ncbi:MAG: hypothetical protein ACI80S_000442 [Pseudohongiellaceae bacterium]|jgi:hypothetical protein